MAEKKEYSLDDILAEERSRTEAVSQTEAVPPAEAAAPAEAVPEETAPAAREEVPREERQDEPRDEAPQGKKGKKKKKGFFSRRKKMPDFDESDDMYYGIQLKPIDEYRKGFDPATGEFTLHGEDDYSALFDDSKKAIDDEVEENFQRLQRERRRRVAQAVQSAGVDEDSIADEFGVVAPMPVTAFAADPYARQHGIEAEGVEQSDLQKAMEASSNTMEIKLNVLNDTMEIQRVKEVPAVSDETVSQILESAETQQDSPAEELPPKPTEVELAQEEAPAPAEEEAPAEAPAPEQEAPAAAETPAAAVPQNVITGRPLGEIPQVANPYEYRSRSVPTHVINADVLQSALLSESEDLRRTARAEEEKQAPRRRVRNQRLEEREEDVPLPDDAPEEIDDYTGPEDAKSIANELRGRMHEMTLRMLITGVCAALLAVINLIFGGRFSAGGDLGNLPLAYVILSILLVMVGVGICWRTILGGLRSLFAFDANADSAVAVAAVAVLIQTVGAMFFRADLADGRLHLYGAVLCVLLFVNAAGKLSLFRRIHSNFRFVTSKDQKYSVRTYEDYNTALKMARDKVMDKPLVAYQCRAGFLKRFLELSNQPDPAQRASHQLAPIGLIASLILCIVSLLITRSVPTAVSALAAACCACVAIANMLAINLPLSRLCATARRAGAMVVGYEAVDRLGNVNAVLVDADEVFPRGTVTLNGIKTFGNRSRAETAILLSSALMKEVGGPLSGVFDQVISENEDALPAVQEYAYEDGAGIVGRVGERHLLLGTRAMMINHQIEVPTREEESRFATAAQQVIYLAVENELSAMLVLSYAADRRRKTEFQRLEEAGVSVLIRTTDPNVTAGMVAHLFGVDPGSVGVLEGSLNEEAAKALGQRIPRADAVVATKGRMESMLGVLAALVEQKRSAGILVAVQNAGVILGFVLVAFLACFGGMRQLTSLILCLFQLVWLVVLLVLPRFRR